MSIYTILGKTVYCKRFGIEITLTAKYVMSADKNRPYEAKFAYASCPLADNYKKEPENQWQQFKYLNCDCSVECPLLQDFNPVADVRKNDC